MTPEVLLSLGRLSDPQLSPDGKTILYGVSYTSIAENRSVRNLYTVPVKGGQPSALTKDGKSISAAKWSADGSEVLFLQGGQLWKAPYKAGKLGKRVQLTDVPAGVEDYAVLAGFHALFQRQNLLFASSGFIRGGTNNKVIWHQTKFFFIFFIGGAGGFFFVFFEIVRHLTDT